MIEKPKEWVFSDPRLKDMRQDYAAYTEEDFQVWKILFERQVPQLPKAASKAYLEGMKAVKFTADRIANFEELNEVLRQTTGWQVEVVPGLIDDDLFFGLLSNKRFPSSTWLRKMEHLDYLEEPDMFHDAFGVQRVANEALLRALRCFTHRSSYIQSGLLSQPLKGPHQRSIITSFARVYL
jgi:phenylalanine-4-hydroxylase